MNPSAATQSKSPSPIVSGTTEELCTASEPDRNMTLARFHLQRIIGIGSFSEVFLARDTATGKPVAIKSMSKVLIQSQAGAQRLLREKSILAKLRHPLVVSFHGSFQDDANLYLVTEFVAGGELYTLMEKRSVFSCAEARFYVAELVLALEFLHARGVVYRDLKPENILLSASGHIKLTDFGFAKEVKKDGRTFSLCGTPHSMAPEVITRAGHGYASDMWSLGICLYEMIAGHSPFEAETPYDMYAKIISQHYQRPKGANQDTLDLIEGLLKKDESQRLNGQQVMHHKFFKGVDWDHFDTLQPVYIPEVKHEFDDSHFSFYEIPETTSHEPLSALHLDGF